MDHEKWLHHRFCQLHHIDPASTALIADEGLVFEVELKGLGSLGDKISSELSSNIPGYEKRRKALD